MCLAMPVKIEHLLPDGKALAEIGPGVQAEISVQLLSDVKKGDYVLLHAGCAISKIDEEQARETLKDLEDISRLMRPQE